MKKLILLMVAAILCDVVSAQTQKVFCQIVGTQKFAKNQVTVAIDFGQEEAMGRNAFGGSAYKNRLVDESGKPITFNSMVDAMNYMGTLGWEFEQAYVVTMTSAMGSGQNVYHWLLSKNIHDGDAINEGFKTKSQYKEETAVSQDSETEKPVEAEGKKKPKREWNGDDLYY